MAHHFILENTDRCFVGMNEVFPEHRTASAGLMCFLQLLEEREHFRRWRQQKVAKMVHCGEPFYRKSKTGPLVRVAKFLLK